MKISRSACLCVLLFAFSCADSNGTVAVDANYNLTCPDGSVAGCGSLAPETCLGSVGQRSIVGSRGDVACNGDVLDVKCEAIERPDGRTFIALEAYVVRPATEDEPPVDQFAITLDAILGNDSVEDTCEVTIIEDGLDYGGIVTGACGVEPPSVAQPCQITNVSTEGGGVEFDLECEALLSSTTTLGFDVGAVRGGPARIRFSNCTGL